MFRLLPLFFLAASFVAHAHSEDNIGSATYRGQTSVVHDGDFIDFTLEFAASCYDDRSAAKNRVIDNVAVFTDWLTGTRVNYAADINYSVELITVWRTDSVYHDVCPGKYYASQQVKIRVNKIVGEQALEADLINVFYSDLQVTLGSLNYSDNSDVQWYSESKVTGISKGVFEDTAATLYREARAKAESKVTRDFLSFLGSSYLGWWHLHSVEFSEIDYGQFYVPMAFERSASTDGEGSSVIKLEPIKVTVDGIFVFHFQTVNHRIPNENHRIPIG